jgi:hypothetical protein
VPSLLDVSAPPFVTLGICFGLVGIAFFVVGSNRNRQVRRDLSEGGFKPLNDRVVWWLTVALVRTECRDDGPPCRATVT